MILLLVFVKKRPISNKPDRRINTTWPEKWDQSNAAWKEGKLGGVNSRNCPNYHTYVNNRLR